MRSGIKYNFAFISIVTRPLNYNFSGFFKSHATLLYNSLCRSVRRSVRHVFRHLFFVLFFGLTATAQMP